MPDYGVRIPTGHRNRLPERRQRATKLRELILVGLAGRTAIQVRREERLLEKRFMALAEDGPISELCAVVSALDRTRARLMSLVFYPKSLPPERMRSITASAEVVELDYGAIKGPQMDSKTPTQESKPE